MINLDERLKEIVQQYARLDVEANEYLNVRTVNYQMVEASLKTVFAEFLTQDGVEHDDIDKNCKILRREFHPDRYTRTSAEAKWLIDTLSQPEQLQKTKAQKKGEKEDKVRESDPRGVCFNLVTLCADIIKNPPPTGKRSMADVLSSCNSIQELIDALNIRSQAATTLTQRAIINSIISMLDSAGKYYTETSTSIPPGVTQILLKTMPYISTGICVALYINELTLLYAVVYTCSKGGQKLGRSHSPFLQDIGYKMQQCSSLLSCVATALTALVFKLNLGLFYTGIKAYESICRGSSSSSSSAVPHGEAGEQCMQLAIQPHYLLDIEGRAFKTISIKLTARPLELYEKRLESQCALDWRLGRKKIFLLQTALIHLQEIDGNDTMSLKEKLKEVDKIINSLTSNRDFNVKNSNAAEALSTTRDIFNFVCKEAKIELKPEPKIPAYDGRKVF